MKTSIFTVLLHCTAPVSWAMLILSGIGNQRTCRAPPSKVVKFHFFFVLFIIDTESAKQNRKGFNFRSNLWTGFNFGKIRQPNIGLVCLCPR